MRTILNGKTVSRAAPDVVSPMALGGHHSQYEPLFNHPETYPMTPIFNRPVPFLDAFLRLTAQLVPGLSGGGVFYCPELPWLRIDAWTEERSYNLHFGKLEVVLDWVRHPE